MDADMDESRLRPLLAGRVVLLGASNVARGISTILETAELVWGQPLDALIACGHGRSYGAASRLLGRSLPGILECGLWDELARRPALPTAALVTDVGNDILYGASVARIAAWVDQCLARLGDVCQMVVITELPMQRIALITPRQYGLWQRLLFPGSQVTFDDAMARVDELNECLRELARRHGATLCVQPRAWYGLDPIHIRRADWSQAWHEILASWTGHPSAQRARGSWRRWLRLRAQRPLVRSLFGIEQRRAQPSCALRSGTLVSLF